MRYFISDTHFFHRNILKLCPLKRFPNFEEKILENLKRRIKSGDTLYHIGDFSWTDSEELLKSWLEIPGRKVLIKGNHDWHFKNLPLYFDEVVEFSEIIEVNGKKVLLCHFPSKDLRTFRYLELQKKVTEIYKSQGCSLLIHGHVHWNPHGIFCGCHLNRVKCLNVNVEFTNYRALSEEELPLWSE